MMRLVRQSRSISSSARSILSERWKISEEVLEIISAPSERSVHRFIEPRALFLASRLAHRNNPDPFSVLSSYFKSFQGTELHLLFGGSGFKDPKWMKSTLSEDEIPIKSFDKLHHSISENQSNGFHINKRMEYFYSILKVFNDPRSLDHNLPPDKNLQFGFFFKVLTSGIRIQSIPEGDLYFNLEKEIATYSRFYDSDYNNLSTASQFNIAKFPKWMSLGNISEFKDKLKVSFENPHQLEALVEGYEPICHWNMGHFSEALTMMGHNTDMFFRSLDAEPNRIKEIISAVGLPLILNLQVIISDLIKGNMDSAFEYYRLISDDLHQKHGIPLLQYLMESNSLSESLNYLNQPTFNRHFNTPSVMSLQALKEMENLAPEFLFYFLKTFEAKRSSERSKAMSTSIKNFPEYEDSPETVVLMGKALRDLTDIQILEFLNNNELKLAVESLLLEEFNEDALPSKEVGFLLVNAIKDEPELLKLLRDFLPSKHFLKDRVLEVENTYFLSKLRFKWQNSSEKSEDLRVLLKYFTSFVEYNHDSMHDEAVYSRITDEIVKHVRFFCDSLFTGSSSCSSEEIHRIFADIQSFGTHLRNTSDDTRLMVACWEGLFFSGDPTFYKRSEELISENPWIPHRLNIEYLIQRIKNLENLDLMSRLVDICQAYDLKEVKSAVLAEEGMMDQYKNIFSRHGLFSLFKKKFNPK